LPWWQRCITVACFFEPDTSHNGAASGSLASGHPRPDCLGPQCSLWNCGGSQGASSDWVSILRLLVAGRTRELSTWHCALVHDTAGVCPCCRLPHSWWQVVACRCSLVPVFCHAIGVTDCVTRAMVAGGFSTPWVVVGGVLARPFKVAVHKPRVF
jgi:hypothetical protein